MSSLKAQTDIYWAGRATLYRCYDAKGRLLYLGVSGRLPERLRQHRRTSTWWPEVVRVVVKVFRRRIDAFAAESPAIRAERPLHNARYGPDWIEPGKRRLGVPARRRTAA